MSEYSGAFGARESVLLDGWRTPSISIKWTIANQRSTPFKHIPRALIHTRVQRMDPLKNSSRLPEGLIGTRLSLAMISEQEGRCPVCVGA